MALEEHSFCFQWQRAGGSAYVYVVLDYNVDFSLKIGKLVYFLLRLDNVYVLVHVFFLQDIY